MTNTYCEKFGFDTEKRARRLALLALGESDLRLAQHLHNKAVAPHVDEIIDYFYVFLSQDRGAQAVMARGFSRDNLKKTMREYLLTLGLDFHRGAYFEQRLRIGMAHVWAGVDLSLYLCSYRTLQQLLIDRIPKNSSRYDAMLAFVLKITALDMSLATEAYHNVQLHGLEQSLEAMRGEQTELNSRLQTDALTGMLSRDHVMLLLRQLVEESNHKPKPVCVVMADLDHFKRVNDTYGHAAGDQVLRDVAARMQGALRGHDAVGRYGGEEFVVVLNGAGLAVARTVAERIRQRVAAEPVSADGVSIPITISQGLAEVLPGETVEAVLKRADDALYAAKHNGRDRVEVDDPGNRS